MADRRSTGYGVGVQDDPTLSNAPPNRPVNWRWDDDTKRFKWNRDSASDMTSGNFSIRKSSTWDGTYSAIKAGTVTNPSSGTTVSWRDMTGGSAWWYKCRAKDNNGVYSAWTMPVQWPDDDNFCTVEADISKIINEPLTGYRVPQIKFELEDTSVPYENSALHVIMIPEENPVMECDDSGRGYLKLYRSSVLGNKTYKATLIVGSKTWTATEITIPDSSTVNLSTIAEFS